jgi:hypothetical protein
LLAATAVAAGSVLFLEIAALSRQSSTINYLSLCLLHTHLIPLSRMRQAKLSRALPSSSPVSPLSVQCGCPPVFVYAVKSCQNCRRRTAALQTYNTMCTATHYVKHASCPLPSTPWPVRLAIACCCDDGEHNNMRKSEGARLQEMSHAHDDTRAGPGRHRKEVACMSTSNRATLMMSARCLSQYQLQAAAVPSDYRRLAVRCRLPFAVWLPPAATGWAEIAAQLHWLAAVRQG